MNPENINTYVFGNASPGTDTNMWQGLNKDPNPLPLDNSTSNCNILFFLN
jgi:hypothetical protein